MCRSVCILICNSCRIYHGTQLLAKELWSKCAGVHKPPLKTQALHYTRQGTLLTLWGVRYSEGVGWHICLEVGA